MSSPRLKPQIRHGPKDAGNKAQREEDASSGSIRSRGISRAVAQGQRRFPMHDLLLRAG